MFGKRGEVDDNPGQNTTSFLSSTTDMLNEQGTPGTLDSGLITMTYAYANRILASFGEITLKHGNFHVYRKTLLHNAREKLAAMGIEWPVRVAKNRLSVELPDLAEMQEHERDRQIERVIDAFRRLPGISVVAPRLVLRSSEVVDRQRHVYFEALTPIVVNMANMTYEEDMSFSVRVKRPYDSIQEDSMTIERELGGAIIRETPWESVDIRGADRFFHLDFYRHEVHIGVDRLRGIGGLPVGTSGRLISLLSGGIDSPVAAYLMAKRGCRVDFVHFTPDSGLAAEDSSDVTPPKAIRLTQRLSEFIGTCSLYVVPEVQFDLATMHSDTPYKLLIFRRFMTRCAERIMQRLEADAIVVGDSLAQVASQTMSNMVSASRALDTPLLRPLIGMDKDEIMNRAREIGTYGISIEEEKDCCAMMATRAKTHSEHEDLHALEAEIIADYDSVLEASIEEATRYTFHYGTRVHV